MMKLRFLHYLLKDKEGYHKDEELKQRWDTYLYVINTLTIQSFPLLKDKFIYFLKYKKWTTFKRFLIGVFIVGTVYLGGSLGVKSIKGYLNTKLGWFEEKKESVMLTQSIYVPDTIEMKVYLKNFIQSTGLNESQILQKFEFITVYTVDSTKTLKKFLERLGQIESGNNYKSRRPGSQYLGRWQMGDGARRTIGFGSISYDKFLNTPEIQDAAVVLLLKYNYDFLKPYLKKYDNKIIRGYHLTKSGLMAMAHNVGADAVLSFLNSGCSNVPRDGNGPSDRFLILGNYDLSSLEK